MGQVPGFLGRKTPNLLNFYKCSATATLARDSRNLRPFAQRYLLDDRTRDESIVAKR
jgi:hypothetical protein